MGRKNFVNFVTHAHTHTPSPFNLLPTLMHLTSFGKMLTPYIVSVHEKNKKVTIYWKPLAEILLVWQ